MPKPPSDIPGLLEFVGRELYGNEWKTRLAAALAISRSTLRFWLLGLSKTDRDIASDLVLLVDRECDGTLSRSVALTALRHAIVRATGKVNADAA